MFGTEYSFGFLLLNFIILTMGIFSHFLKKKIRGQTIASIKEYFKGHFVYTLTMVIAAIAGFIGLITTGSLGIVASFLAGYAADSIFNKADGEQPN